MKAKANEIKVKKNRRMVSSQAEVYSENPFLSIEKPARGRRAFSRRRP
jgi:hypothetical protein